MAVQPHAKGMFPESHERFIGANHPNIKCLLKGFLICLLWLHLPRYGDWRYQACIVASFLTEAECLARKNLGSDDVQGLTGAKSVAHMLLRRLKLQTPIYLLVSQNACAYACEAS